MHNTEAQGQLTQEAHDFACKMKEHIRVRFEETDPVAKAMRLLDYFKWCAPHPNALASHGQ